MRNSDLAKLVAGAMLAIVPLMLAASAQPLQPTSPPQLAPVLPPAHVVDLMTADGMAAFGAQWKHMEAKIVEGPALPNAMPGSIVITRRARNFGGVNQGGVTQNCLPTRLGRIKRFQACCQFSDRAMRHDKRGLLLRPCSLATSRTKA